MKKCYDCAHVEMCGWRKEVKERGCEFFDDGMVWIPCSERLPEYGEKVLTYDGVTCWVEARIPFVLDEKGEELKAEWWVSDDVDHEKRYYPNLRDGAAIAWMPLPEPYRKDEESEV